MNNDFKFFIIGIIIVGAILGLFILNIQAPTGLMLASDTAYSTQTLTASSDRYINPDDGRVILRETEDTEFNVLVGDINYLLPLENDNIDSVGWEKLINFPAGCPDGQVVRGIGSSLVCSEPLLTSESDPLYSADKDDIVFDGDNISRLFNDVGYITSFNDTNCSLYGSCSEIVYWVDANDTFYLKTDFNYLDFLTTIDDYDISLLNNDLNFQSYDDVVSFTSGFVLTNDLLDYVLKDDFNVLGDARYYLASNPSGFITSDYLDDYITEVDANDLYMFKFDLDDFVSWVDANDTFYKRSDFNYLDFLTSISGLDISLLNNDLNFQTYDDVVNFTSSFVHLSTLDDYLLISDANNTFYKQTDFNYLDFLTSISGLNVSDLVNDSNYQTYDDILAFNFLTSISGLNVSDLVNDSNFQTYDNVLDFGFLSSISGLNVSELVNDLNFQTFSNLVDYAQPKGDYLTSESDPIFTSVLSDVVFDGNNVSRLVNDAGYLTSYTDTNCSLYGSCGAIVYWQDANVVFLKQADANDWFVLEEDFNVLGDARYYQHSDFNYLTFITSADLSDYLKEVDANNIYAFKTDLKDWVVWADANNTFYKQTDFNYLDFLTSISGLNVSDLVNDSNYQTYDDILAFNFLTSISGLNVSDLVNDSNFQTYDNVLDFGFLSSISGLNVSELVNDLNFQTFSNLVDYAQPKGDYLTSESDPIFTSVLSDVVFDGNNVSRLVNDAGYLTSYTDTNFETAGYDFGDYVPYTGATTDVDLGANNLIVDTSTLFVDATNNRIGIGTTTPTEKLEINGNLFLNEDSDKIYQGAEGDYSQYFDGTNQNFDLASGEFRFNNGDVLVEGDLILGGSVKRKSCPSGYVLVPGNSDFGNSDFCVMKYEAKQGSNSKVVSTASGTPWVSISWYGAKEACRRSGGHLITNAEWMTIARDVEGVASNWSEGSVGSGYIYSGHNDGSPNNSLVASSDDGDGYFGTGNGSPSNQRRTLTLSNGEVIWDLAGNVWQWVDEQCDTTTWTTTSWTEWSSITGYRRDIMGPSVVFGETSGVGKYYGCLTNGNALVRGGGWNSWGNAGVFTMHFINAPSSSNASIGFRCVR
jgi:formylglycine-generating enzyme required for sulfatase activity